MSKITSVSTTTFKFLKDLEKNNNRDWFAVNKDRYVTAQNEMKGFAETLFNEMSKIDNIETYKVFRIYRDVRFSKNKTPYKNNLGASMKRATKWLRGGYYVHVEPGNSFLAAGFLGPNPADLKRIRQEIAANDAPLRKIIKAANFKKHFGTLKGDQVKTAPKGYAKDHPAIDLLRYKQLIVTKEFSQKVVTSPGFDKEIVKSFKAIRPFLDYMSDVLTTDANGVRIE